MKENGRIVWQGHEDADQGVAPSDGHSLGYGDASGAAQTAGSLDDALAPKHGIDADEAESSPAEESISVTADSQIVVVGRIICGGSATIGSKSSEPHG